MHTVTSVVKRYPLVTFFILTYIFSWWGYFIPGLEVGQIPLGPVVAALIVVSTFGAVAGSVLTGARVGYAMALDRNLPAWLGRVHPRWQPIRCRRQ